LGAEEEVKRYHVEYYITVPDYAEWGNDDIYTKFKCVDPGYNQPYVFVPLDADITEVNIPLPDGIYVAPSQQLYKKSLGKWDFWDEDGWTVYEEVDVDHFLVDLIRIDA
jgi:hypothetical protein